MREHIDNNNVRWFMPDETKTDTRTDEQKLADAEARFRDGGYERERNDLVECCARAGYEAMVAYLEYSMTKPPDEAIWWSDQPEERKQMFRNWVAKIMDGNWNPKDTADPHALVSIRLFGQVVRSILIAHGRLGLFESIPGSGIAQLAVSSNVRMKKLPEDALTTEE